MPSFQTATLPIEGAQEKVDQGAGSSDRATNYGTRSRNRGSHNSHISRDASRNNYIHSPRRCLRRRTSSRRVRRLSRRAEYTHICVMWSSVRLWRLRFCGDAEHKDVPAMPRGRHSDDASLQQRLLIYVGIVWI